MVCEVGVKVILVVIGLCLLNVGELILMIFDIVVFGLGIFVVMVFGEVVDFFF